MNLRPISASIILCSIQSTTTNVGLRNKRICIPLCMGNKYIGMELRLIESYQSKMRNLIGCMICIQNEKTPMRFTSMPKIYSSYRPYNNLTFVLNLNSIDNNIIEYAPFAYCQADIVANHWLEASVAHTKHTK